MEKIQPELLEIAKKVIEIMLDNSKVIREYQEKTESYPAVQLFGASQVGKSTLISCLTLGEQWIPIGTGTPTTAVKTEILSVDSINDAKAQIKWLTKDDLLQLVQQTPMDVFIQALMMRKRSYWLTRKNLTLDSPEDRELFLEALYLAKKERENDVGEAGEGETLKVVETILSHYESYLEEFVSEDINIKNIKGKDLSQLLKWTQRPHDWEIRPISDYKFDELRCFFTKEVRLYVPTQDAIKHLRILDTPGFGVNLFHNSICREAQREAKAIVLVVGSQLTLADLDEIKQLKAGISDSGAGQGIKSSLVDNIFIIWNQKEGTKDNAIVLLDKMLKKLKQETNITVPRDRVAIVNLRLALRAMQSKKIAMRGGILKNFSSSTFESLFQIFSNNYPHFANYSLDKYPKIIEKLVDDDMNNDKKRFSPTDNFFDDDELDSDQDPCDEALDSSGWNDVIRLVDVIQGSQDRIFAIELAANILEVVKNYLQRFSTPKERIRNEEQYKAIRAVLAEFQKKTGSYRTTMEDGINSNDKKIMLNFLSYLTDNNELSNLKKRIENQINSELRFSNVPGKIKANLIDYVDARCSAWIGDCTNLSATRIKQLTLGDYDQSVFYIDKWINSYIDGKGFENFMLPVAQKPKIDLESFRTKFKEWSDDTVKDTFDLNFLDQVGIVFAEMGNNIEYEGTRLINNLGYQANRFGAWLDSLGSKNKKTVTRKDTERKPDFDRDKAFKSAKDKIDKLLSEENFEDIYKQGKQKGLLDIKTPLSPLAPLMTFLSGNSIPTDLSSVPMASFAMTSASTLFGAIDQAFIDEKCKKFCRAFKECKYGIAVGLNTSFDDWCESTLSLLEGRRDSLSRKNPLIPQEDLMGLEQAVIYIKSLLKSDIQTFNDNLSKEYENRLANAETLIGDRKG
jgi:hypothetical protein